MPVLACLTSLAACAEIPKTGPTEEEREKIQEAVGSLGMVVELADDVVALADPDKLADKSGGEGDVKEFKEGIHDAYNTVLDLWGEERVFVYEAEDVPNPESNLEDNAGGFFGSDLQGNFIALERAPTTFRINNLVSTLMHEGAHNNMGHTEEIMELYDRVNEGDNITDGEWTDAAIMSRDFPYELDSFCRPASGVLNSLLGDLWVIRVELEEAMQLGDWERARRIMELRATNPLFLSEWEREFGQAWLAYELEKYGVDKDALRETVVESRLYGWALVQYREGVQEIYQELSERYEVQEEEKRERRQGEGRR